MLNHKQIVLSVASAVCLLVPASFVVAQTATAPAAQTQKATGKTIKFTIQNKSASAIDLKSGDQDIHLAAGQSQQMKAPAGTKIVTTSDSSSGQAGTVVAEVTDSMSGSTVNLR